MTAGSLPCPGPAGDQLAVLAAGLRAGLYCAEAGAGLHHGGGQGRLLHAGGHRDAMVTLPPGIPPHLRRKGGQ